MEWHQTIYADWTQLYRVNSLDILNETTSISLQVALEEHHCLIKLIRNHPLGTMNVCIKLHNNLSNIY